MLKIEPPFCDIFFECPECQTKPAFKNTPDLVIRHLVEYHFYTELEADTLIKDWMEGFEQDDDGSPLEECPEHGYYHLGDLCPGCDAVERQIDAAIEREHERKDRTW